MDGIASGHPVIDEDTDDSWLSLPEPRYAPPVESAIARDPEPPADPLRLPPLTD